MKILITGASGFIGRHLIKTAIATKHEVFALSRRPSSVLSDLGCTVIVQDVLDITRDDIPNGTDAIIHLATGNDGDREHICHVAVEGTTSLLKAAKDSGVRHFMQVSSLSVYPGTPYADTQRIDKQGLERHPEKRGVYAESKVLSDIAAQEFSKSEEHPNMTLLIVRPGLVFGTDMLGTLAGTAVELPLGIAVGLGSAKGAVPVIELDEMCRAMMSLLEQESAKGTTIVHNILADPLPTKRDFLKAYEKLTGRARHRIWLPKFVPMTAAIMLDLLFRLKGQSRDIAYKVGRIYAFNPDDLDRTTFWNAIGTQPRASLRDLIALTLSIDRNPPLNDGAVNFIHDKAKALNVVATLPTNPSARHRLVIVGAGRIIEEMHIPALKGLGSIQVSAIVDPASSQAQSVAEHFPGAKTFASLKEVPNDILDGGSVLIATPGDTHLELAQLALQRNAGVLMEKPVVLSEQELSSLTAAAKKAQKPVTVFQNYRMRGNAQKLWAFLASHDVGAPVRAKVVFHSGRILTDPRRWYHEEKNNQVMLMELAIHFLDIALLMTGPIKKENYARAIDRLEQKSTVSANGSFTTESGALLDYDFSLSGTTRKTEINVEFERSAIQLNFFPEGFRILPKQAFPADDILASLDTLWRFAWDRLKRTRNGIDKRAIPHAMIYREHLRCMEENDTHSIFGLDGVKDTMDTAFNISRSIYPDNG